MFVVPPHLRHLGAAVVAVLAVACGPISGVPLVADPSSDDDDESTSSATSSATSSGSTGEPSCGLPTLDDITLGQEVFIAAGEFADIPRGTSRQLHLAVKTDGFPQPLQACVTWRVLPSTLASINDAGLLFVASEAAIGSNLLVIANIENGRRFIELGLRVYEPVVTPLLGYWSETARLPCDDTGPFLPTQPVGELAFFDNGKFRVTWTPFEAYVDYWGTYSHAPDTGALVLSLQGGNQTPIDLDGIGTANIAKDGALELTDMFLGSAPGETPTPACGHRF